MAKLSFIDEHALKPGGTVPSSDWSPAEPSYSFVPIPPEEMGFALSLFVAAANGQIAIDAYVRSSRNSPERDQIFRSFGAPVTTSVQVEHLRTLEATFSCLWRHYQGDDRQTSICARVLSFYCLMERTKGLIMARWVTMCPESPEAVLLHPAVIEVLACISLGEDSLEAVTSLLWWRPQLRAAWRERFWIHLARVQGNSARI